MCIPTHEREELLAETLEALGRQTRPPAEIVVSDSSSYDAVRNAVEAFAARHPGLTVRYCRSTRKALPWQRWWAFTHSSASTVLFLDDDILLQPDAIGELARAYEQLSNGGAPVGGIGFAISGVSHRSERGTVTPRERWLRIVDAHPGSVTAGGLTTPLSGLTGTGPQSVEVLSGGAMSYRRDVLEGVGCLNNLMSLYDSGLGRGEDAVLSSYARRLGGPLYALPEGLAFHPRETRGAKPYAGGGWRMGMAHTWGRAHTMRWIATTPREYRRDWSRVAALELARAAKATAVSPLQADRWKRLAGACWGICKSLIEWKCIPLDAH